MLETLKGKDASIIILLAEGYDGVFVRSVLEQVPHKESRSGYDIFLTY